MSISETDLELQTPTKRRPARLQGFPSFAQLIARDQDAAIYLRYSNLSARTLLYLQSELHQLEGQLRLLDSDDAGVLQNEQAQKAARDWSHYCDAANERARQHRELQQSIRTKIKEYHEALLLESQVLALSAPSARTLTAFKRWFNLKATPVLWGRDQHLFDDEADLVALAPVDNDRLNLFLKSYFGWLFQQRDQVASNEDHSDLYYYPQRRIQTARAVISVLSSAVLLVGAIICLLSISGRSMHLRIGMIVLFTCLFALVVGLITNARRAEIFGATAA